MQKQEMLVAAAQIMNNRKPCEHAECNRYYDAFDRNVKEHGTELMDWDFDGLTAIGLLLARMEFDIRDGLELLEMVVRNQFPTQYAAKMAEVQQQLLGLNQPPSTMMRH